MNEQRRNVLLVEDSPADVELAEEVFNEIDDVVMELSVVENGEKIMQYLRGDPPFQEQPRPDLVILDLDLPKKDGFEVLEEVKEDTELKVIPIVVLTMSNAEEDIYRAYELGANCCITKPLGFEEFKDCCNLISRFWLGKAHLPGESDIEKT